MKPIRLFVSINSCHAYWNRRNAARETWLTNRPKNVSYRFFLGSGVSAEPDTVCLPVDDHYHSLAKKQLSSFRYALENHDFDYLFKCDDDTLVRLHLLAEAVVSGIALIGDADLLRRRWPAGGAGYFVSRAAVQVLVQSPMSDTIERLFNEGHEDVWVGLFCDSLGLSMAACPRLNQECEPCWGRDNYITVHHCEPDKMRTIYTDLTNRVKIGMR